MGPERCTSSWSNDFDGSCLRDCASVYGTRKAPKITAKITAGAAGAWRGWAFTTTAQRARAGRAFLVLGSNFQRASPGGPGRRCALPYSIPMYMYWSRVFLARTEFLTTEVATARSRQFAVRLPQMGGSGVRSRGRGSGQLRGAGWRRGRTARLS